MWDPIRGMNTVSDYDRMCSTDSGCSEWEVFGAIRRLKSCLLMWKVGEDGEWSRLANSLGVQRGSRAKMRKHVESDETCYVRSQEERARLKAFNVDCGMGDGWH